MPHPYLATVTIPHTSGLIKDAVVNDFAFTTGDATPIINGGTLLVTQALADFYNANSGQESIARMLSPNRSRALTACIVRYYDLAGHLDGSNHGSPVAMDAFTLGAQLSATPLPEEVACVLTLRGEGWSTASVSVPQPPDGPAGDLRPKQQRSGRLYIGPFNDAALANVGGNSRPSSTLRDAILDAAERLGAAWDGATGLQDEQWCVWSRKLEAMIPMEAVQMDDAWDVQRRRGVQPLARETR